MPAVSRMLWGELAVDHRRECQRATNAIADVGESRAVPLLPGFPPPHDLVLFLMDAFMQQHVTRHPPPAADCAAAPAMVDAAASDRVGQIAADPDPRPSRQVGMGTAES